MKLAWRLNQKPGEIKYFLVHEFEDIMGPQYLAFPSFLNIELLKVLCKAVQENKRIRVFYGKPVVGETQAQDQRHYNGRFDIGDNFDVQEGYLKCTAWKDVELRLDHSNYLTANQMSDVPVYYPILKTTNSVLTRHYDLRPEEIVRVDYSNQKDGGILWQHSCFHEWYRYGEEDILHVAKKEKEISSI